MDVEITIPTFHAGQVRIYLERQKRNAVRCGRRFGKTEMLVTLSADGGARGEKVGVFAPEHKQLQEPYDKLLAILHPIVSASNKTDGVIKTEFGGKIDFWRLIDNELAGRGREYDKVLIDEAAFTKNGQMLDIWRKSILPTMATRPWAEVWIFSTPNGIEPSNFFYQVCHDPELGFKEFWAPSSANPMVDPAWLAQEKERNHPDIFRQEFDAQFVDWSGTAFFSADKWLENGQPVDVPVRCDYVFAIVDTAVKTGSKNDGTAVTYFAFDNYVPRPLWILDWDIQQMEGAVLEEWMPQIFANLENYARLCGARHGSIGAWVEDKASGMILNQQAARNGWPVMPIDGKLTSLGKDERSINVSGYHHRGLCQITQAAWDKTTVYKGISANHFRTQVCGFRIGVKDQADDLLDCYTYGLATALGDGNWN